jgi:hypothetical protein
MPASLPNNLLSSRLRRGGLETGGALRGRDHGLGAHG